MKLILKGNKQYFLVIFLQVIFILTFINNSKANIYQERGDDGILIKGKLTDKIAISNNNTNQLDRSENTSQKLNEERQHSESDLKKPFPKNNGWSISAQERKKRAMQLLDYILVNAVDIKPVEYSILTQVEGATLLWKFDKGRSLSILKDAVKTLREVFKGNKDINKNDYPYETKGRQLRFLIVRKIAALKPELVKELFIDNDSNDKNKESISGEWTDNARAILYVASEQIENNPALASQMAQQAFTVGMANWLTFLRKLGEKDNVEAERFAKLLIDRLRDSSNSPIDLRNLISFILDKGRSSGFREYYFQAILIRLQRDLRPDTTLQQLEDDLSVARGMFKFSGEASSQWQLEFQKLVYQFEALFKERSLDIPGAPVRRVIDMSVLNPASPGDTSEISDAVLRTQSIKDSQVRDKEYQKLATKAAVNADPRMADEILSKINDMAIRQETSLMIYSPLVRKSVSETDWTQAQTYALRILDPIGLALVMDSITQAMTKAGVEKHRILYAYTLAVSKLDREEPSGNVAKAFLLMAKSLLNLDNERCRTAINYAIDTINAITKGGSAIDEAPVSSTLSTWVRYTSHYLRPEELLDLNDTLMMIFTELAKRDDQLADQMAVNLNHQGLRSLARLAVGRALLSEVKPPSDAIKRKKASAEK
jgi:hypothetical protein